MEEVEEVEEAEEGVAAEEEGVVVAEVPLHVLEQLWMEEMKCKAKFV